jgi:run domain Beclin-1 interacting cysteine-rich containing protein
MYNLTSNDELDRENRHFVLSEAVIAALEETRQAYLANPTLALDASGPLGGSKPSSHLQQLLAMDDPTGYSPVCRSVVLGTSGEGLRRPGNAVPSPQVRLLAGEDPSSGGSGSRHASTLSSPRRSSSHRRWASDISHISLASSEGGGGGGDELAAATAAGSQSYEASVIASSEASWVLDPSLHCSPAASESGREPEGPATPASVAFGLLRSLPGPEHGRSSLESLQLLVQGDDVPQSLLPMPVVHLSEMAGGRVAPLQAMSLRGNSEWAPPRNQIVFTVQLRTDPKPLAIRKQGYRCAGCGLRVELNYIKVRCGAGENGKGAKGWGAGKRLDQANCNGGGQKFRFDEYLGKYFCTSCHRGDLRMIPARIVHLWDFKRYRVSSFSSQLLDTIADQPEFDLSALNKGLLRKNKLLATASTLRYSPPQLSGQGGQSCEWCVSLFS